MTTTVRAQAIPQMERGYVLAFLVLGVVGVVLGFVPPSWARFNGQADYAAPLALQIHAGLFLGWVGLVAMQILLIRQGNTALHKRLGLAGTAMVPAMAISSVFAETYSERFAALHHPGDERFLIVPIFSLGLFLIFTTAGLLLRQRAAIHKRLILLGTALLFGAAWSRVTGPLLSPLVGNYGLGFFTHRFIMTNAFLGLLALLDWRTRGRLQTVSAIGISITLGAEIAVTALYHTAMWLGIADAILVYFPGP